MGTLPWQDRSLENNLLTQIQHRIQTLPIRREGKVYLGIHTTILFQLCHVHLPLIQLAPCSFFYDARGAIDLCSYHHNLVAGLPCTSNYSYRKEHLYIGNITVSCIY